MKHAHLGSELDSLLEDEGVLAECESGAIQRVLAWQIEQEMKRRRISKANLATRMKTTPASLAPLFSGAKAPLSIQLVERAALALGKKLKFELA